MWAATPSTWLIRMAHGSKPVGEGLRRYGGRALRWEKNTGAGKWAGRQAGRVKNWGVRTGKHLVSRNSPLFEGNDPNRGILNRNKYLRLGYSYTNKANPPGWYFGLHGGTTKTTIGFGRWKRPYRQWHWPEWRAPGWAQ